MRPKLSPDDHAHGRALIRSRGQAVPTHTLSNTVVWRPPASVTVRELREHDQPTIGERPRTGMNETQTEPTGRFKIVGARPRTAAGANRPRHMLSSTALHCPPPIGSPPGSAPPCPALWRFAPRRGPTWQIIRPELGQSSLRRHLRQGAWPLPSALEHSGSYGPGQVQGRPPHDRAATSAHRAPACS